MYYNTKIHFYYLELFDFKNKSGRKFYFCIQEKNNAINQSKEKKGEEKKKEIGFTNFLAFFKIDFINFTINFSYNFTICLFMYECKMNVCMSMQKTGTFFFFFIYMMTTILEPDIDCI